MTSQDIAAAISTLCTVGLAAPIGLVCKFIMLYQKVLLGCLGIRAAPYSISADYIKIVIKKNVDLCRDPFLEILLSEHTL